MLLSASAYALANPDPDPAELAPDGRAGATEASWDWIVAMRATALAIPAGATLVSTLRASTAQGRGLSRSSRRPRRALLAGAFPGLTQRPQTISWRREAVATVDVEVRIPQW